MVAKVDIVVGELTKWDEYKDKKPEDALPAIYAHIADTSKKMCTWYWTSIKTKRWTSLGARCFAFLLLILGTILPIYAATLTAAEDKLRATQWAVALLAVAGLTQVADNVFGWSSGWIRYITTVTTMENLTRAFQMEWAKYLISKATPLDMADVKSLFDLARGLEQELTKLQAEETTKWVADFNTGTSLLEGLIKSQREETDKKLEAIRTSLTTEETSAKAERKAKLSGSLEVKIVHKEPDKKISISLDEVVKDDDFLGNVWSQVDVLPGPHKMKIVTKTDPPRTFEYVVEIKPEALTKYEADLR